MIVCEFIKLYTMLLLVYILSIDYIEFLIIDEKKNIIKLRILTGKLKKPDFFMMPCVYNIHQCLVLFECKTKQRKIITDSFRKIVSF